MSANISHKPPIAKLNQVVRVLLTVDTCTGQPCSMPLTEQHKVVNLSDDASVRAFIKEIPEWEVSVWLEELADRVRIMYDEAHSY